MGERPYSADQWKKLLLVKQLTDQDYSSSLHLVFNFLEPLTGRTRPPGAEELTDHDIVHSARIVYRVGEILLNRKMLTQTELYLFLLAALLHDAGMWVPREEANAMLGNANFLQWAGDEAPVQLASVQAALRNTDRDWLGRLGLQQLAALWGRRNHPERLGTRMLADGSPTNNTLRALIKPAFLDAIVSICVAHSWERHAVVEHDDLRTRELGHSGDPVRVRLLAALLRLGDLLDLGEGRISTLLWDYLRPLPALSEAHWRKEHTLKVEICRPDQIVLAGKFEPRSGVSAPLEERHTVAEAYRLALEWVALLKAEIAECTHVVEARVRRETGDPHSLGDLSVDSSRVHAPHLAVDGPISFQFNRKRIVELLGDEIYSIGSVFVRELLQNATDTTRAAILRKYRHLSDKDPSKYPPNHPWEWPSEIVAAPEWAIEIETAEEKSQGQEFTTFLIRDHGLGMTLDQVRNHFLQVGSSFYQTNEFAKEFSFPPISCFGIGFLSCLAVASRIEVHTRSVNESHGLLLSLQFPSDQYVIEKDKNIPLGTTVKLWIDRNGNTPMGWDDAPMDSESQLLLWRGRRDSAGRLGDAVGQWALFLEIALKVNNNHWPPGPLQWSEDYFLANYLDLPLRLLDPDGRFVAKGRILHAAHGSGLPTRSEFNPRRMPIIFCNRGFWVQGQGAFGKAIVLLNAYHLPPRSLAAPRSLRGGLMPLDEIRVAIIERIYRHASEAVQSRGPALTTIWHANTREHMLESELRFPVRTVTTLEWLTLRETIERHKRIVIVPLHVAVQNSWRLPVPAFGWPKNGSTLGWPEHHDPLSGPAIEVKGECTGILFPPNADFDDLPLFTAQACYTPLGLRIWTAEATPRTIANSGWAYNSRISDYHIPEYDKRGDPWSLDEKYLDQTNIANSPLPDYQRIAYPADLLDFVIEGADKWE
jgi:hypothetical protein